jgi:hypothetical protein
MFTAVSGKQNTYEALRKALYGHSRIICKVGDGDNEFVALIRTEREDEGSCRYNAQSQADRLRSFMQWQVVGPYERPEMFNDHDDFYGVLQGVLQGVHCTAQR